MYIAGEDLTMGDIPMGCAIWRWMALPIERPVLANLQRWFDTLRERRAYKERGDVARDTADVIPGERGHLLMAAGVF